MNPNKLNENQYACRVTSYSNDINKRQPSAQQPQQQLPFFILDSDKAYAMPLPTITHHQNHHQVYHSHPQPQHMPHSLTNSSFKDSMSMSTMSLSSSCSSLLNSSNSLNSTWSSVLYLPSLHPHLFSEPNYVNINNTQTAVAPPQTAANSKRETFYENFFTNLNANGNFNKNNQINNMYVLMNGANRNNSNSGNGKTPQLRRMQNNFGPQLDSKFLLTANSCLSKSENDSSEFSISFEEINKKVNDLINSNADDVKFSKKNSFVSASSSASSSSSSSSSPSPSMDDESEEYMNNKEVSDLSSNMNLSDTESNCNESNLSDSSIDASSDHSTSPNPPKLAAPRFERKWTEINTSSASSSVNSSPVTRRSNESLSSFDSFSSSSASSSLASSPTKSSKIDLEAAIKSSNSSLKSSTVSFSNVVKTENLQQSTGINVRLPMTETTHANNSYNKVNYSNGKRVYNNSTSNNYNYTNNQVQHGLNGNSYFNFKRKLNQTNNNNNKFNNNTKQQQQQMTQVKPNQMHQNAYSNENYIPYVHNNNNNSNFYHNNKNNFTNSNVNQFSSNTSCYSNANKYRNNQMPRTNIVRA